VGLALRCFAINGNSFWYDEAYTAMLTRSSLGALASGAAGDGGNPPLYWLIMRVWFTIFGDSEAALRSFSVICGVATIPLLGLLGHRLFGATAGLLAAGLWAISPLSVELSNEARCYALLHLLIVLNTLCLMRWAEERRWRSFAAYSLTTFLCCYCHYYALLLPPAYLMMLASSPRHRRLILPWAGAMAIAAILWLPWLGPFLRQLHQPGNLVRYGDRWPLQFIVTPLAFSLGRTFAWRDSPSWLLAGGMLISLAAFVAPALYGLWRARDRRWVVTLLLAWLALPYFLPLIAALAGKPLFHHRAASVSLPAFLMLLGYGVWQCEARVRAVLCMVILSATGVSLWRYATVPLKDDWRDAVPVILSASDGTGPVLFDTSIEIVSFEYYARSPARIPALMFGLPQGLSRDGRLLGDKWQAGQRVDPVARDYTSQILSAPCVYLVQCVPASPGSEYAKMFAEHGYQLARSWRFTRIDIYLFTLPGGLKRA
jgi:4-amino-4-deoxy-L-arabinose transferase-like glycosyltransferase